MVLYLGVTLCVLLGVWLSHHYKNRGKKLMLNAEELLVCEYCHCAYLAEVSQAVTRCPDCRSYNKNNPYQRKRP